MESRIREYEVKLKPWESVCCVLGKTLYSHSASVYSGVYIDYIDNSHLSRKEIYRWG